jgi:hypothetical protein
MLEVSPQRRLEEPRWHRRSRPLLRLPISGWPTARFLPGLEENARSMLAKKTSSPKKASSSFLCQGWPKVVDSEGQSQR